MSRPQRLFLAAIFCQITSICLQAQVVKKDAILGKWLVQDGDAIVQVYQRGDKFDGKIVWLKTPLNRLGEPMKDTNNVDWKLRAKPAMGLVILKDFVFTEDGNWEDGTVYDPKNGKTYKCIIKAVDRNRLEIRGYIGISLLGRTEIWKRNE